jgi:hypothetical protein
MGFVEQVLAGTGSKISTTTFTSTPPSTLGETSAFGVSYILLGVTRAGSEETCRIRLYGESSSVALDAARSTSSFDIDTSRITLNLDAVFSSGTQSITFDPPVIATAHVDFKTYYNIESSQNDAVTVTYYPIQYRYVEDFNSLKIPTVTLGAYETASGNVSASILTDTAKSFIMTQAIGSHENLRLRLYSLPIEEINSTEKSRPYETLTGQGSRLIIDMLFDSASYTYRMIPVLQGFNLESYESGNNRIGYIFENLSGSIADGASAGVQIFPLED